MTKKKKKKKKKKKHQRKKNVIRTSYPSKIEFICFPGVRRNTDTATEFPLE